jgi:aminopeptidase N
MIRRRGAAVWAAVALTLAGTSVAAAGAGSHGSAGLGDPFFPKAGNGGYEVGHYGLHVHYQPQTNALRGTAKLRAKATQPLDRFDLDLRGLDVERVRVDGAHANFSQSGQELVITPAAVLADGSHFAVTVEYSGKPKAVTDPDGSLDGWIRTDDGAWVASEPQGSPSWFPANDHPSDKAKFDFRITVPAGLKAVCNGQLVRSKLHRGHRTFSWHARAPMAAYLATATIGRFHVKRSRFDGLRSYVAVDPTISGYGSTLAKIPAIVRFFSSKFGPYPFGDVGAIVDPSPAGYSLEIQTRPLLPGPVDEITLAHELSHQWFGDSVSLETWPDIWLNEGFATFAEMLWEAHSGGPSLRKAFHDGYSVPASDSEYWNPPPGDPGSADNLFDGTIYVRGGLALEALREKIGSHDFYGLLRQWATDHRHGNANTQEFIDLAASVSGQNLDNFFDVWLFQDGKPASGGWKAHGSCPFTLCSRPSRDAGLAFGLRQLSGAFTYRGGR